MASEPQMLYVNPARTVYVPSIFREFLIRFQLHKMNQMVFIYVTLVLCSEKICNIDFRFKCINNDSFVFHSLGNSGRICFQTTDFIDCLFLNCFSINFISPEHQRWT